MKVMFFSDVHGCTESLEKLSCQMDILKPDMLVLLGDALYHGPRNPLKADYAPPAAVEFLNSWSRNIMAVRGNCDSEVDQMMLNFPMMCEYSQLAVERRRFFLTHGHIWNPERPPQLPAGTVLAYGHTHIYQLGKVNNLVAFNPGSISLPKSGNPATFGFYADGILSVRELDSGNTLAEMELAR